MNPYHSKTTNKFEIEDRRDIESKLMLNTEAQNLEKSRSDGIGVLSNEEGIIRIDTDKMNSKKTSVNKFKPIHFLKVTDISVGPEKKKISKFGNGAMADNMMGILRN